MPVDIGLTAQGTLPFQTTSNTTENINQADTSNGGQANRYTAAQQAGQNQAINALSGVLSGTQQVPSSFGMPQAVYDAAFANFNKFQLPQLTAGLGSGAAGAINAAQQELQLQLAGMAGQNAMSNFNSMAGNLGNLSFNAVGQDTNQAGNRAVNRTLGTTETGFDSGAALGAVLDMIGQLAPSLFGSNPGTVTGQIMPPLAPNYQQATGTTSLFTPQT